MESLATTAGVKCSTEGQDRNVSQKKCTSGAAQPKRSSSVELEGKGWQQLQEGQNRDTCGLKKRSDSGKSLQFEDQHTQIQSTSLQDYEVSSYPLQSTKLFPIGRQKAVDHLVSAQSPGPASHIRSTSSPEVQQHCSHSGMDQLSETVCKVEQKPQKPGKYVCDYCGRACAKPSVLKKHIRSHTGERPYPCVPCGFAFKTKSNLYKHRKSHAHSVKAGSVPLSELGSDNANTDQGSFEGEGELFSDAEQSTDTDEDTFNDPLLLLDSPVEGSDNTAVKVLNLIAQKKGATSMSAQDGLSQPQEINAPAAAAEASHAIQSCTIKQRLALRLSEKRSSDSEHNLSLPSQSSKGSTDSGYFSRSESAEHQTGPPNTNAKSYQEIMFGKCYRPSPKQTAAFVACSTDSVEYSGKRSDKGVSRVFTQEKDTVESIKINTKSLLREEVQEPLLDAGSDMGPLIRSNSMPTSSAVCLTMPQALRGSHSFDERTSTGGMRRLRRQAAFELSAHDADTDSQAKMSESGISPSGLEMENYPFMASNMSHQRHAMELATRKRRKEKREEEDLSGQYEGHHDQCEEMFDSSKDYDLKQAASGIMALEKGHSSSMLTQMDRCDMDISVSLEMSGRKTLGNVISVIQHTSSINKPLPEQSESYKYHGQRQESIPSFQAMGAGESYEMERSDSRLRQSFQMGPKLVRQPNIQVPEIRVTVEPDSPEKAREVQVKEPEKQVEEFQWPQRSETLAQFPPEKLPPKKKRLRLADIEHSSGESSFESACTSLSRSPSQDSNLSYCSTFSFDREESLKSVSPARQDDFGKPLELLAVPGSGHSLSVLNQRQQHEMRRSSSEQAPCNLRKEFPEARSISFDYDILSPTSKVRQVDISVGNSAVRDRRRGNLVRQESLNMETEVTQVSSQVFSPYPSTTSHSFTVAVLPQTLPIFSTANTFPQLSHPSLLVPVRIQTHVPSYGSITYTSVSKISDNQYDSVSSPMCASQNQTSRLSRNLDPHNILAHTRPHSTHTLNVEALDLSSAKLKTGIPLSLTSRTISTTNASSGGANKRMLSPASSLDLFMEVKQQKRVKEERMFGQIVEELSAVELGKCNLSEEKGHRSEMQGASTPHAQDDSHMSKFITLRQKATEATDHGFESAMESSSLESSSPLYSVISVSEAKDTCQEKRVQMDMVAQLVTSQDSLISDTEHSKVLSQFPSLRTTTGVSWCYLNYTKPSCSHSNTPFSSVYATWCVSAHNPNPLEISTSTALALLQSKQRGDKFIYTVAAMCQPGTGKLVSSVILWRQTMEQVRK